MDTAQTMKRSLWFRKRLSTYQPDEPKSTHTIEAPPFELQTFKCYKQCAETGEVVLNSSAVNAAPRDEDVDRIIHNTITILIKAHTLARHLQDCQTTNKIMDALLDYFIQTRTVFAEDHIGLMEELCDDKHHWNQMFTGLSILALDTRTYTPPAEQGWRILDSRDPSIFVSPFFIQDQFRSSVSDGSKAEYPFGTDKRERYYCWNRHCRLDHEYIHMAS